MEDKLKVATRLIRFLIEDIEEEHIGAAATTYDYLKNQEPQCAKLLEEIAGDLLKKKYQYRE